MEDAKAIKFSFSVMNNFMEYEALISGLELARWIDVRLKAYSDSNLLVHELNGESDVRDPTLKQYVELAKDLARCFEQFQIKKIL